MTDPTICPDCGDCVERTARAGRTSYVAGYGHLPIPSDFKIPTCQNNACGAEWVDGALSEELTLVMKEVAKRDYAPRGRIAALAAKTDAIQAIPPAPETRTILGHLRHVRTYPGFRFSPNRVEPKLYRSEKRRASEEMPKPPELKHA